VQLDGVNRRCWGSDDNHTVQTVQINALPAPGAEEVSQHSASLVLPLLLEACTEFDDYTIVRESHGSSRSHVYLAADNAS
jgi:hypothetical protein